MIDGLDNVRGKSAHSLRGDGMTAAHSSLASQTVMVVDADIAHTDSYNKALRALGHSGIEFQTRGPEALERLKSGSAAQLLILDLHLPDMDGIRFMRELLQIRSDLELVLVSGENRRLLETTVNLGRSMGLNVLGALPRPLELASLKSLLNRKIKSGAGNDDSQTLNRPLAKTDLQEGLAGDWANNRPVLLYQPIVSLLTGNIVCVEVLTRWWNRERGLLTPEKFLPLAEKFGLLDELSRLIYQQTLKQVADWLSHDQKISAAINVSINSFNDPDFANFLIDAAAEHKIDCARLVFEMAETQTSSVQPRCLESLLTLRLKGFRLSIDDFGTGSSSLTHLKNIPFTELKIDREFVTGASDNAASRSILEASVNLAKRLNIAIVAEGVESRQDWDLVEALQCDYVQGYYCGKPMDNKAFLAHLESWQGPHSAPRIKD
jgi:EAL domain-containing protein (putative c-di-GMP-specific phosphodiesterase class I)/ActR/RegA family two-component response regulator